MTKVIAVKPYEYTGLNFKDKAFNAWKDLNYDYRKGYYPRILRWLLFRKDIYPTICQKGKRLVFVQPISLFFDAGTSVINHEVIPVIWDCWPKYYNKIEKWLRRHQVKTAFFTSSQEMVEIKRRIPQLQAIHCPEGIDTSLYKKGKELKNREIDVLEFGRNNNILKISSIENKKWIKTSDLPHRPSDNELFSMMEDAKITICFPRNITHPEETGGIETLTQRYWEAMLSRMIILGHCPKELKEFIGYNPLIEYDYTKDALSQINDILQNTTHYQNLVNKNRETALRLGDWKERMKMIHDEICPH